jgi:hypothetical protein
VTSAGRRRSLRFSQPNAPYLFQRPEAAITWRVRDIPHRGYLERALPTPTRHAYSYAPLAVPISAASAGQSFKRASSRREARRWRLLGDRVRDAEMDVLRTQAAVASGQRSRRTRTCRYADTSCAVPGSRTQGILSDRIRRGSSQRPAGCQPCLRSASALSPSARIMAALGAEPQLRVRRKSSGRTKRRSSISCCGSHRRSSTRAQKRAW